MLSLRPTILLLFKPRIFGLNVLKLDPCSGEKVLSILKGRMPSEESSAIFSLFDGDYCSTLSCFGPVILALILTSLLMPFRFFNGYVFSFEFYYLVKV